MSFLGKTILAGAAAVALSLSTGCSGGSSSTATGPVDSLIPPTGSISVSLTDGPWEDAQALVLTITGMEFGHSNGDAGIDVERARRQVEETGWLEGLPGTEPISNGELLELPCDILIPAAIEGTINCDNAEAVRAGLVVEAANTPVTHMAERTLLERGIPLVPDLLANAGGVLASYYEWVQNRQEFPWERATVLRRLEQRLGRAYEQVRDRSRQRHTDLRTAAYELAIGRVSQAMILRGL